MIDRSADSELFRSLLGCFATGVTVATTIDSSGSPCGMTASAVSAVSVQPPLLLICVNREASFHTALSSQRGFALNVLATGQEAVSEAFASGVDDPFAGMSYRVGLAQLPLLDGAVAHIICAPWGAHAAGDHTVFLGKVTDGRVFEGRPLVHYRSRYTTTLESGH